MEIQVLYYEIVSISSAQNDLRNRVGSVFISSLALQALSRCFHAAAAANYCNFSNHRRFPVISDRFKLCKFSVDKDFLCRSNYTHKQRKKIKEVDRQSVARPLVQSVARLTLPLIAFLPVRRLQFLPNSPRIPLGCLVPARRFISFPIRASP